MVTSDETVPIGTLGISMEDIPQGNIGEAYFPSLNKRMRIYAIEYIRKHRDIIIVGANNSAKEHSPVEISYETVTGRWQRVTEQYPLPTTMGTKAILYVTKLVTEAGNTLLVEAPGAGYKIRVHYFSYSNKHTASVDVAMRFGSSGDLKHRHVLAADGGNVNANLTDCCWEGGENEALYAYLAATYANGVIFNVGYTIEEV